MAIARGVEMTGVKELDKALKQLPEKVRNRVIGPATLAGIKPAVKAAKRKARKIKDTGALAKSIFSKLLKRRRGRPYVVATMGPDKDSHVESGKYPYNYCSYYGMVVEYGWSDTGISPSKMTPRAGWVKRGQGSGSRPPYPFMRSSIEEIAPHVLANMQKNIEKKIEREAAKLAKSWGPLIK